MGEQDDEMRRRPGEGAEIAEAEPDEIEILGIEGEAEGDSVPHAASEPPAAAGGGEGLAAELEEAAARYLRLRADFDNYRKRSEREREELLRYALAEPLRGLLPVVDNLERAIAAQGAAEDLRRGVEMIGRQLAETLRKLGVAEVPTIGERFDPRMHEAVMREESADVAVPTVIGEFQKGYWLHDRLLRPAMVRVAVPAERHDQTAAGDAAESEGA